MKNNFKFKESSVHEFYKIFLVKRKLTLNIERSKVCGGSFSLVKLAVCPAKDTICTSGNYNGDFTRFCKSRSKNINIVNIRIINTTDFNYPFRSARRNKDFVNREGCGVITARSEPEQSDNEN